MRLPRDISGADFIKLLKPLGYELSRQAGSHMRLTTQLNGTHHITIPAHDPLKIGTLSAILSDIADHFGETKDGIMQRIF